MAKKRKKSQQLNKAINQTKPTKPTKPTEPTIKIKINGEERPFEEEVVINNWQVAKEEVSAAADETIEGEDFEWVLPEITNEEVPEFQKVNYTPSASKTPFTKSFRRKLSPNISSLIISIFLAVAVGLLLGLLLWKMVIDQDEGTLAVNKSNVVEPTAALKEDVKKQPESPHIAQLPAFTTAIIQADVFSQKKQLILEWGSLGPKVSRQ